jgi:branched-chain amino acid transport system permease protein
VTTSTITPRNADVPTTGTIGRGHRGSRVSPQLVGLLVMTVILVYFVARASSFHLFIFNSALLAIIGASALNLLMGTVGQVSIGNAAFLVVGAFTTVVAGQWGLPFPLDVALALVTGGIAGLVVGLPALRIRGIYLAFASLAANFIFVRLASEYQSHETGPAGFIVPLQFPGLSLQDQQRRWAIVLFCVVVAVLALVYLLLNGRLGRAWRLIRDNEIVAPSLGIDVTRYKLAAFVISSALISMQGSLAAHFAGYVSAESFTLTVAIAYVAMVFIGGTDSQLGSIIGAAVVIWLPYLITDALEASGAATTFAPQISQIAYGALIIFFVTFSNGGLAEWARRAGRWTLRKARRSQGPTDTEPLASGSR